ncbi:MAG: hypothetical protein ACOC6Q_00215 [Patescibacteria group bacterium]
MTQKIIKTGNSAAVTIPVEFFDALCLRYGDNAEAELDFEKGTITYTFPNGRQLPLSEIPTEDGGASGSTEEILNSEPGNSSETADISSSGGGGLKSAISNKEEAVEGK